MGVNRDKKSNVWILRSYNMSFVVSKSASKSRDILVMAIIPSSSNFQVARRTCQRPSMLAAMLSSSAVVSRREDVPYASSSLIADSSIMHFSSILSVKCHQGRKCLPDVTMLFYSCVRPGSMDVC